MGTWNAFYVRRSGELTAAAVQKRFPSAEIELGEGFLGVIHDEFLPPTDDLSALSADLATDVIWLSFQSVVDAFAFHHWQAGLLWRSLVFGVCEERTWERVEGEPEPWERTVFFDPRELTDRLEYAKTEEERRELQRMWRDARLQQRLTDPGIDSRVAARKIAKHYQFPGWS